MADIDYGKIIFWGLDFYRAINERPKIIKRIINLLIGKYAKRELAGLKQAINDEGLYPDFSYACEECEYNKEKVNWF